MNLNFEWDGNSFISWTREAAEARGVPDEVISAAEASAWRGVVSRECRRRIYSVASAEAQMNLSTAVGVISAKGEDSRTDDDRVTLAAADALIGWISEMRGVAASQTDPDGCDVSDDTLWPQVPPQVTAAIKNF